MHTDEKPSTFSKLYPVSSAQDETQLVGPENADRRFGTCIGDWEFSPGICGFQLRIYVLEVS